MCRMKQHDDRDHGASADVGVTRNEFAQARRGLADDRTVLASERSLPAWYRTAFGSCALSPVFGGVLTSLRGTSPTLGTSMQFSRFASRSWAPDSRLTGSCDAAGSSV